MPARFTHGPVPGRRNGGTNSPDPRYRQALSATHPPTIPRDRLEAIADTLACTVAAILDRAALTAATRVLYGVDPLGPARTLVAGYEYDLTDAEAERVADFITGLISARDLR